MSWYRPDPEICTALVSLFNSEDVCCSGITLRVLILHLYAFLTCLKSASTLYITGGVSRPAHYFGQSFRHHVCLLWRWQNIPVLSDAFNLDCLPFLTPDVRMKVQDVTGVRLAAEGVFTDWVSSLSTGPEDECGSSSSLPESSSNHSGGCLCSRNSPIVSFIC